MSETIGDDCSICFDNIALDSCVKTICGHMFCTECFFKWIKSNTTCAICRTPFTEPYKAKEIRKQEKKIKELNEIDIQLQEFIKINMKKYDKNEKNIFKQNTKKVELEKACKKLTIEKKEINLEINALRKMLHTGKGILKKSYNKEWSDLYKPKKSWWRRL